MTQTRIGVFETNSSSTHVLSYCESECEADENSIIPDLETKDQWEEELKRFRDILLDDEINTVFTKYMTVIYYRLLVSINNCTPSSIHAPEYAESIKNAFKERGYILNLEVSCWYDQEWAQSKTISDLLYDIDRALDDEVCAPDACSLNSALAADNFVDFVLTPEVQCITMDTDVIRDWSNPNDNAYNVKMYTKFYEGTHDNGESKCNNDRER